MTLVASALLAAAAALTLIEATVLLLAIRAATRARHRAERPSPAPFAALPTPPSVAVLVDGGASGADVASPAELVATVDALLTPSPIRDIVVALPEGPAGDAGAAALAARFALHDDGRGARSVTHPHLLVLHATPDVWAAGAAGRIEHVESELLLPLRSGERIVPGALERAAQALAADSGAVALAAVRTHRRAGFRGRLAAIRHARSEAAPQLAFGSASAGALLTRSAALIRRRVPDAPKRRAPARVLLQAETLIETPAPPRPLPDSVRSGPPARLLGGVAALLAQPLTTRFRTIAPVALVLLVPLAGDLRLAGALGALLLVQGGLAAAGAADLALLLRPDLRGARPGWALLLTAPLEAFGVDALLGAPPRGDGPGGTMAPRSDP